MPRWPQTSLDTLAPHLAQAIESLGFGESFYESFYDLSIKAAKCPNPSLSSPLRLGSFSLESAMAVKLNLTAKEFIQVYEEYVATYVYGVAQKHLDARKFLAKRLRLGGGLIYFYFPFWEGGTLKQKRRARRIDLLVLTLFAMGNYSGKILVRTSTAFIVSAAGRYFGYRNQYVITDVSNVAALPMIHKGSAGLASVWKPAEQVATVHPVDRAYTIINRLDGKQYGTKVKASILEALSIYRHTGEPQDFSQMMGRVGLKDSRPLRALQLDAIEFARNFRIFNNVKAEVVTLLQEQRIDCSGIAAYLLDIPSRPGRDLTQEDEAKVLQSLYQIELAVRHAD